MCIWYIYIQKYVCICACHCVIWTIKYMNTCTFVVRRQLCLSFFCSSSSSSQRTIWCLVRWQHTLKSRKWQSQSGSFLRSAFCWRLLNWFVLLFSFCKADDSTHESNHNSKFRIFLVLKKFTLRWISRSHVDKSIDVFVVIDEQCLPLSNTGLVALFQFMYASGYLYRPSQTATDSAINNYPILIDRMDVYTMSCISLQVNMGLNPRWNWGIPIN